VAHPTELEEWVGVDVQDPVRGRTVSTLRGEVALGLAADADEPEELDDGVVFRPG